MNTSVLTTDSVSKLFFRYLIPSICGTMVTSIYVLADTIIIGKGIGTSAMAALNIVLPVFSIFFGFGLWYGIGGSVLMSIARGRGNREAGEAYFSVALLLNILTCILCTLCFWFFMEPIMRLLGATDVTMPYIRDYAPYVILGLSCFAFSTFLQTLTISCMISSKRSSTASTVIFWARKFTVALFTPSSLLMASSILAAQWAQSKSSSINVFFMRSSSFG